MLDSMAILWILVEWLLQANVPVLFIILLLGSYTVPVKKCVLCMRESRLKIMTFSYLLLLFFHLLVEKELVIRSLTRFTDKV